MTDPEEWKNSIMNNIRSKYASISSYDISSRERLRELLLVLTQEEKEYIAGQERAPSYLIKITTDDLIDNILLEEQ